MPTFPVNNAAAGVHFVFGRPSQVRVSAASLETLRVAVVAKLNGVAVDPTIDVVSFAFAPGEEAPASPDYVDGNWESTPSGYYAACLIGPGGAKVLTADLYGVWLKVSDDPEVPIRRVGDIGVS